jgi:hypothetical protein
MMLFTIGFRRVWWSFILILLIKVCVARYPFFEARDTVLLFCSCFLDLLQI